MWLVTFLKLVFAWHAYFRMQALDRLHSLPEGLGLMSHLQRPVCCVFAGKRCAEFVWSLALGRSSVLHIHWLQWLDSGCFAHFLVMARGPHLWRLRSVLGNWLRSMLLGSWRLRINTQLLHRLANVFWSGVLMGAWRRGEDLRVLNQTSILLVKASQKWKLALLRRLLRTYDLGLKCLWWTERLVDLPALYWVLLLVEVEVVRTSQFAIRNILLVEFLLRWTFSCVHL